MGALTYGGSREKFWQILGLVLGNGSRKLDKTWMGLESVFFREERKKREIEVGREGEERELGLTCNEWWGRIEELKKLPILQVTGH